MPTPRLGAPELATSQAGKEATVNEQIRYLESGAGHFIFKDRDLTAPPGGPADGDCYLVAAVPTGAWAGQAGKIAYRLNTAWIFIAPREGFTAWVNDEDVFIGFDAAAWNILSTPSGVYMPLSYLDTDTALTANSDSKVASQKAVKTYVDQAVTGLLDYKGARDCSANPNYPAAAKGDAYVISVAGKTGGAAGIDVDAGDVMFATADNAGGTQAAVGASWVILEHNGLYGGAVAFASAAEIQAGANATKAIAADQLAAAAAPQVLADGATVNWDMAAGYNAKVVLGGNRPLAVSNPKAGWTYTLNVGQDATGSRTVTWPASFDWGAAGAPVLTTTPNKHDRIVLFCTDAATPKFEAVVGGKGFS